MIYVIDKSLKKLPISPQLKLGALRQHLVNYYIKTYKKKCGFIILLIACIVFGFWYYFQIGGLVGFTIICISFYLIIWGILNTYKIKELFYMLLNLI